MEAHLQLVHYTGNTGIPSEELATIVDLCDRPVDIFEPVCGQKCILCRKPFENVNGLQDHLATHMEDIALFVLPDSTDMDDILGASDASLQVVAKDMAKGSDSDFGSGAGGLSYSEVQREHAQDPTAFSKLLQSEEDNLALKVIHWKVDEQDSAMPDTSLPSTSGSKANPHTETLKTLAAGISNTKPVANSPVKLDDLVSMYVDQRRWDKAEELQLQILQIKRTKLGDGHPDTALSMASLASTYRKQGRWAESEQLEVQAMETLKKKLGAEDPSTLTSMANLALTYFQQGMLSEAEEIEVQVMETRKKILGTDHFETLISIGNLASIYGRQGRLEDAEKLEVQVLETRMAKLGADHSDTLSSIGNLASTYRRQGR